MDNNKKDLNVNSPKLIVFVVGLLAVLIAIYFGLPHYTKYKAKQDLENIGITFSEQKFVEKACNGDDGSVALFIAAGMNINVLAVPPNNDGTAKSALHCAAGTGNLALVKSLLDLGADVNVKDDASNTPLFSASGSIRYYKRREVANNLDIVKLLIERGADINSAGVAGPALVASIQARSLEVFDYLLEKGANVKVKNKDGMTPLMLIAYSYNNRNKEIDTRVNALIKAGAVVNEVNNSGQTALMIAVNNRSTNVIRTLLENGADPSVEDKNGSNILGYALSDPEILKLFLEKGADPNVMTNGQPLLHQAALRNDAGFQILLANKKTDVNIKNSNGDNVLHVLARTPNYAQKINFLIASAASISVNAPNNQLETPLIKAVQSRNIIAVNAFIDSKANVNARDAGGRTALYYAYQNAARGVYDQSYNVESSPAEMAPSGMSVREMMRTNNSAALQRYLAEMQARNGTSSRNNRMQIKSQIKDPLVDLLLRHGATV